MNDFSLSAFLEDLKALCAIDSGHFNAPGTAAMAAFLKERFDALELRTELRYEQGNDFAPVLLVSNCEPTQAQVLMLAHMDTVFPVGTAAEWPFTVDESGIGHGPGCADCKGGCLSVYYLLKDLLESGECRFRFCAVFNSDEERGSNYSRAVFEQLAQTAEYCFVFEPGRPQGEFVAVRKGGANYLLKCHGIAAHAGVEPEKGASAILELSRWVQELYTLTDYEAGTTVTVGRFDGGSDSGQVPDYAECTLNFRYLDTDAFSALEALFERMRAQPFDSRTHIEIEQKSLRPPMTLHEKSRQLLAALQQAGEVTGSPIRWISTGGCSDGNWVAHYGVATLDGCGPCGGKLHTRDEYLLVDTVETRLRTMRQLLGSLY